MTQSCTPRAAMTPIGLPGGFRTWRRRGESFWLLIRDGIGGQHRGPNRDVSRLRRRAKMFRAGLYARVSTNDQQTLAMQNRAMREYAARRGWTIALHGAGQSQICSPPSRNWNIWVWVWSIRFRAPSGGSGVRLRESTAPGNAGRPSWMDIHRSPIRWVRKGHHRRASETGVRAGSPVEKLRGV